MKDITTRNPIDLPRFCTVTAPDFAPLGGSRPDRAVLACAAMWVYEGGLPGDVILPPDVLDTALAALCAPVVITDRSDVRALNAHFHYTATAVPLRQQPFCVAMSLLNLYDSSVATHPSGYGLLSRFIFSMASNLAAVLRRLLTHPSGYRTTSIDCQCNIVPVRLRTIDMEMHERLCMMSEDTCGVSITVQLDGSVTALPGVFFDCRQFKYMDLRQSSLQRVDGARHLFSSFSCQGLMSVMLPASLTEVRENFLNYAPLQELNLRHTSLLYVGDHFLNYCKNLTSVEMPDCLTDIGSEFLSGCDKLESINLRNTAIQKIGGDFASNNHALTSVELPDCVTEIGRAFLGCCKNMECIDLRNTALQRIDRLFGFECRGLTKVYLPDSVSEVGREFLCCMNVDGTVVPHGGRIDVVSGSPAVKAAETAE